MQRALADHLPCERADDAGGEAGEEQGEGEDGAGDRGDGAGQQVVDGEDVGAVRFRVIAERGAGEDQDGAVGEERQGAEGDGQLGDGVPEAGLDGFDGWGGAPEFDG